MTAARAVFELLKLDLLLLVPDRATTRRCQRQPHSNSGDDPPGGEKRWAWGPGQVLDLS